MHEQLQQFSTIERDKLIESHQVYVRKLAGQLFRSLPSSVDFEDLVGFGLIGLLESAERFDPRRGVSFVTFSHYRIRGAMFDGLKQMGFYSNAQRTAWEANANDILQTASDDADNADVSTATIEDEIQNVENLLEGLIPSYLLSLDAEEVLEVADPTALTEKDLEKRELVNLIVEIVKELTPDEQDLIKKIYFKHIPMVEIAKQRGSNKSWISRLHARAIQHIKDKLKRRGILEENQAIGNSP
ncbi:MAG: sigma-70 family RNA polymerase sigma factor [Pyrinomonadaceae bacterium]|jgi:RNA polymerase sigma factor for flagellar operon FliA|nr:sigma-70 family RNA polymerase sigma factor [Pyrinomonadaceae bacterium]